MQGFININKPSGVTSAYVVSKVKKHLNIKKVGHMGTLDPLASGVLPIAIGKATRMFDYFLEKNKQYVAVFEFGYETDTLDSDGVITGETNKLPTNQDVLDALPNLTGEILQMPPKYSAKKIKGKKAYELARQGVDFSLKSKLVYVEEFKLLQDMGNNSYKFLINCSSGTYIRSLGRDLGYGVNSLATMTSLKRVESGYFTSENAIKLTDFLNLNIDDAKNKIIKIDTVFSYFKKLFVNEKNFNKLKNGQSIDINALEERASNTINIQDECSSIFVFSEKNVLLGVGSIKNDMLKIKTYLLEN